MAKQELSLKQQYQRLTQAKFVDYKGVNKLPMQGGAFTPK